MNRATFSCLVSLLWLAATAIAAPVQGERTFSGTYLWQQPGEMGSLEASFKPTGEKSWEVSFHFVFNGSPHTYVGTAQGSLEEGALEGQVESDGRKRTFTFKGEFKGGKFSGTHAEQRGGREERTGTLTLESKPG